jgi:hypothetical protein
MTANLPWTLRCQLKADLRGAEAESDHDLAWLCTLALAGCPVALADYQANYGGADEVIIDG